MLMTRTAPWKSNFVPKIASLFYTDGITEVFDARGAMLGVEGLQGFVHQVSSRPAEEMKQGILDVVAAWREGPPTDDVSLVVVHIR